MSSHVTIDYQQIASVPSMGATTTDGSTFEVTDAITVPVVIEGASDLLAGYTPGATIDATTAETIARAVLDALKAYTG